MAWFHNEESGQTFEAEGYWEEEARERGCEEIPDPTGKKPAAKEKAAKAKESPVKEDASESEPAKKPADEGGKEKK